MTGSNNRYLLKEYADNVEVGEREISDAMELIISNTNVKLLKIKKGSILPSKFVLDQNYPNPFNSSTNISFYSPIESDIRLLIYNILGEVVVELTNKRFLAGSHTLNFNSSGLSSGIYFYTLLANDLVKTKNMILMK